MKNFGYSIVATAPSPADSGTSLTVASGHGSRFEIGDRILVTPPGAAVADLPTVGHLCEVTNVAGDVLTLVRGVEGSAGRSIVVGDEVRAVLTAATFAALGGGERWDASFDGQGAVIATGISSFRHVAATATITQAALVADQSGSITITVKKYTPSGGSLGSATTLGTIALSSAQHNRSTGLTWAVTAGDVIEFVTTATISTVTRVFVGLGT